MHKHISSQYSQPAQRHQRRSSKASQELELPFVWSEITSASVAAKASVEQKAISSPCSTADFKEWLDIELDIAFGRGAYLYSQVERDLEHQRKAAAIFNEMVALQSTY